MCPLWKTESTKFVAELGGLLLSEEAVAQTSAIVGSTQLLERSTPNFGDSTDIYAG